VKSKEMFADYIFRKKPMIPSCFLESNLVCAPWTARPNGEAIREARQNHAFVEPRAIKAMDGF